MNTEEEQGMQPAPSLQNAKDGKEITSPFKEWVKGLLEPFLDMRTFWRQRRLILAKPELVVASDGQLKYTPLKFALHMIIIPAILIGGIDYVYDHFANIPPLAIEVQLSAIAKAQDRLQVAAEQNVQLRLDGLALPFDVLDAVNSQNTLSGKLAVLIHRKQLLQRIQEYQTIVGAVGRQIFPITLLTTVFFFSHWVKKYNSEYPLAVYSDRVYLYYVTARLFFPNVIAVLAIHALGLLARYLQWDEMALPIASVWLTFICGIWGLILLKRAAPEVRRILGFNRGSLQLRKNFIENRLAGSGLLTNFVIIILFALFGFLAFKLVVRVPI
ncbi:MAG TPA: hypothetical protein VFR24_16755 [Candidatus Angelobacter sp.]|nr:hypothetical protein [Candidatus Angelobacter sp.]